jgi:DNA polymerase-3 subunit delta
MTHTQIIDQIKKKIYHPIYFLEGDESYFIDEVMSLLEERVLTEGEKAFNLSIFYGRDTDPQSLMNTCRQYPMGSDFQLVLLKEAQSMSKLEGIISYIENPLKSTVLVLAYKYGKLDRRTQFSKSLIRNALHLESKKLYDDKIPSWIQEYVSSKGYRIDARASQLLADYLGNDLGKISGELGKLMVGLESGSRIEADRIESNIGISREYNVFELGMALSRRDIDRVYRIIFYFSANPKENPLVVIIGFLGSFFSKVLAYHYMKGQSKEGIASKLGINPYFISQYENAAQNFPLASLVSIISGIRQADIQSKGVGTAPNTRDSDILKELIYKILHTPNESLAR